jgi:copper transport protein
LLLCLALWPALVSAHAFLDTSSPTPNAVVATAPAEVKIEFTERLQPNASSAQLYDADAKKVDTPASHIGANPKELILPLPPNLPKGTYTVQWQNVSADDGHPTSGFFAFTIGGQSNVVLPAPPPAPTNGSAILSLSSLARWLGLLGLAGVIGSLIVWRQVIAPVWLEQREADRQRVARQIRRLALGSIALAFIGGLLLLIAQVRSSGSLSDVLFQSRFGHLLWLRFVLLIVLAGVIWRLEFWLVSTRARWLALVLLALLPLPYALNSHASAIGDGKQAAVATDWMHLVASSVWVGGLLTLVIGIVLVRALGEEERRAVYAEAIPRFSTLAIIATITLGITGFYAAWLQVGNLDALWHTTYGKTLVVKLVTIVPLLMLGAINLLVIGPALRRGAHFVRHFGRVVGAEALLGVAILAIVGGLVGLPTGRQELTFSSGHPAFSFEKNGVRAALQFYPGTVGTNRYTADVQPSNGPLPESAHVFLRFTSEGQLRGTQQVELVREPGSTVRYSAQGSELSVVGAWSVDLVVRRPGVPDWTTNLTLNVSKTPAVERAPGLPLRFLGYAPVVALLVAGIGLVALVFGLRGRRAGAEQRFTLEAGGALLLTGAVILFLTRAPGLPSNSGNPVPKTAESVAAGKAVFEQHCAVCHGTDGHGDGPAAARLNPPPADLYAAHVDYHSDQQLYDWIRNGITGSAMTGFKGQLSDQQIWDVVNYVRSLRHPG